MDEETKARSEPDFIAIPFSVIKSLTRMEKEQAGSVIQVLALYAVSVVNGQPQNDIAEKSGDMVAMVIFESAKKTIDRTLNQFFIKSENGKKGGAPKGNQNARKKKPNQDGEPAQNPEKPEECQEEQAGALPSEPEPEPNEPLSVNNFMQFRVAKIYLESYERPNLFLELESDEEKAEFLALTSISGSFQEWKEKLFNGSVKTLDEVRCVSMQLYHIENDKKSESELSAEIQSAKEYALKILKYRFSSVQKGMTEYNP